MLQLPVGAPAALDATLRQLPARASSALHARALQPGGIFKGAFGRCRHERSLQRCGSVRNPAQRRGTRGPKLRSDQWLISAQTEARKAQTDPTPKCSRKELCESLSTQGVHYAPLCPNALAPRSQWASIRATKVPTSDLPHGSSIVPPLNQVPCLHKAPNHNTCRIEHEVMHATRSPMAGFLWVWPELVCGPPEFSSGAAPSNL